MPSSQDDIQTMTEKEYGPLDPVTADRFSYYLPYSNRAPKSTKSRFNVCVQRNNCGLSNVLIARKPIENLKAALQEDEEPTQVEGFESAPKTLQWWKGQMMHYSAEVCNERRECKRRIKHALDAGELRVPTYYDKCKDEHVPVDSWPTMSRISPDRELFPLIGHGGDGIDEPLEDIQHLEALPEPTENLQSAASTVSKAHGSSQEECHAPPRPVSYLTAQETVLTHPNCFVDQNMEQVAQGKQEDMDDIVYKLWCDSYENSGIMHGNSSPELFQAILSKGKRLEIMFRDESSFPKFPQQEMQLKVERHRDLVVKLEYMEWISKKVAQRQGKVQRRRDRRYEHRQQKTSNSAILRVETPLTSAERKDEVPIRESDAEPRDTELKKRTFVKSTERTGVEEVGYVAEIPVQRYKRKQDLEAERRLARQAHHQKVASTDKEQGVAESPRTKQRKKMLLEILGVPAG